MICPNCKEKIEEEDMNERIMAVQLIRSSCYKRCSQIVYNLPITYHIAGGPNFEGPKRVFSYEVSDHKIKDKLIYVLRSSQDPYLSCSKTNFTRIVGKETEQGLGVKFESLMEINSFLPFSSQEEFDNLIPRLLKLQAFS